MTRLEGTLLKIDCVIAGKACCGPHVAAFLTVKHDALSDQDEAVGQAGVSSADIRAVQWYKGMTLQVTVNVALILRSRCA